MGLGNIGSAVAQTKEAQPVEKVEREPAEKQEAKSDDAVSLSISSESREAAAAVESLATKSAEGEEK